MDADNFLSIFSLFSNSVFSKELNVIFLLTSSYPVLAGAFLFSLADSGSWQSVSRWPQLLPALPVVPVTPTGWENAPPPVRAAAGGSWCLHSLALATTLPPTPPASKAGGDLEGVDQGESGSANAEPLRGAGQEVE